MPANPKPFNVASYIPPVVLDRVPKQTVQLEWTHHALLEAAAEGYWSAPETLDFSRAKLVEVETNPGLHPTKFVVRLPTVDVGEKPLSAPYHSWRRGAYDRAKKVAAERHMVLTVVKDLARGFVVVTCWSNDRHDDHATLDRSRVVPPPVCVPA